MKELESLLALNDVELNSSLDAYDPFNPSRKGPYRAIQAVTILIFVIHNLIKTPELKDEQISTCTTWAWTCTFTFMGHIIQRCISISITNNNQENCCSLLPAVLVFLEWYVCVMDYAETYGEDEKVSNAKSYFFGALVDLVSGFQLKEDELVNKSQPALWEDHELSGFEPVCQSNDLLAFSTHSENKNRFESGNSTRINRILHACIKIAERLTSSSQNLIFFDKSSRKFSKKNKIEIMEEETSVAEEEEVILFKPLARYNSEPIDWSTEASEDSIRRSSSLFSAQNGPNGLYGPPSLSGWVLNQESLNLEKEKSKKQELAPISEIPTSSLSNLSITESSYIAPIPSAPLLPEEHSILGAPPLSRLPQGVPGFVDAYRPPVFGLSSSEWLYRYNNNLSLEVPNPSQHWPVSGTGNFNGGPRFDVIDKWGNPLLTNRMVYFERPNYHNQRPNVGELRAESSLLQHLKEREWQLQSETPFRGNPYMGN